MRIKEQTIYDLNSEQFKYLKREESSHLHKVDINDLNKRLKKIRKSNFYNTAIIVMLCVSFVVFLCLISFKF